MNPLLIAGLALSTVLLVATPTFPSEKIPQPVIDECNSTNKKTYHKLPDCLKSGTIAYKMINVALSEQYYGHSASQIVEICRKKNKTLDKTWTCFNAAARSSVEIRALIGIKNIEDKCHALISSPDTFQKMEIEQKRLKKLFSKGNYLYVSMSYYPFPGCNENQEIKKKR